MPPAAGPASPSACPPRPSQIRRPDMRRRIELVLPVLVLLGFLATAVVVNLLLSSAEERGVHALEDSLQAEVDAIAGGQDQRVQNTSDAARGFVNPALDPYRLEEGSPEDLARLQVLFELVPDSRTGFYLVDADATITQGVQLLEAEVGDRFEWPGYEELFGSEQFARGEIGVLPVSSGFTTEEPAFAYVIPIIDGPSGAVRGAFVFESVVAADSDFTKEIGPLRRGETGEYLFLDDRGTVIASNDLSLIGARLDDPRLIESGVGVHRFDGQVVVLADVPAAGWRVALRQDLSEFERPLA